MYINPIRLTNNYNTNTYNQLAFKGGSEKADVVLIESTPTADTTQFKSSTKAKEKANNRNNSFAHRLYTTLTNSIQGSVDPYYPVGFSSRPFLY